MRRRTKIAFFTLCAGVLCAGGTEPVTEVPFVLLHNQILVQASMNGTGPHDFVLDSGTRGTTVDLELARRLRLPLGTQRRGAVGVGAGRAVSLDATCAELRIGDLRMTNVPVVAMNLRSISRALGRPLGGVLGSGFLDSRITQIDYSRRRIRIWGSTPFGASPSPVDTPRRASVPLTFLDGSVLPLFKECFVNGNRLPVTIDTGSSFGLILFPAAVQKLGLEALAHDGPPQPAAGYRGQVRLTRGWVRSVRLNGVDLGAIEVAYARSGYGQQENSDLRGGNLGNAVLQDFVLTLDYVNRVVVLEYVAE